MKEFDHLSARIHHQMLGDDRYPIEVVHEEYHGDWEVYFKDMEKMFKPLREKLMSGLSQMGEIDDI